MNLKESFDKYDKDFLKFDRVENPPSLRADVCAFIKLDQVVPPKKNYGGGYSDMVASAAHDEIWLVTDVEELANRATEDDIQYLVRCGVRYDEDFESLAMFV